MTDAGLTPSPQPSPIEGEGVIRGWHYEHVTPDLLQVERVERVVHSGRTAFQSVVIQDTACFGRSLVLDDKTQSTEVDEFVYHESLVQPCMIVHPGPRRVFIAGGGEGATGAGGAAAPDGGAGGDGGHR